MSPGDMDAPAIAKFAQIAIFHEKKTITPEGIMGYKPFSNLKMTT